MEYCLATYELFPTFIYDEISDCYVDLNQRIYPKVVVDLALRNFVTEKVNNNIALGLRWTPCDFHYETIDRLKTLHLERTSHILKEILFKDGKYFGEFLILPTHAGKILSTLVQYDLVETRYVGMGKIKNKIVQDDFKILRFDFSMKEYRGEIKTN